MIRDRESLEGQRDIRSVPVLRFFRWVEPTVSYGRLQNRAGAEALRQSVQAGGLVQRPTGGGMVVHGNDLSFSIVWRRDLPVFPRCLKTVYATIHGVVANVFRARGFDVALHTASQSKGNLPGQCFVEPVNGDILWRGQKVVGGALKVTAWGRLYQGDIRTEMMGLNVTEAISRMIEGFERDLFHQPPVRGD